MEVKFSENKHPRSYEEDQMLQLYKAAMSGSVANLTALLQNDPLILHKVSLTSYTETPLHLSALAGHLDFTRTLLSKKVEFASQLDSLNRSPLHLASAEGHDQVVQELLVANPEPCLVFDDEGKIPLHLAVMRGHVGVIQELIRTKPDSISVKELMNGETVLHLAVRRNKLKALQELEKWVTEEELFVSPDNEGNTILHVASMLKHLQITKYLVSKSSIKALKNAINYKGFTSLDLVEHCPQDFRSLQIRDIFIKAECSREDPDVVSNPEAEGLIKPPKLCRVLNYWKENFISVLRKCDKYLKHRQNWIQEMQGTLMLVATLTATISYQSAMHPPECEAGTAMLAYGYPSDYLFFICNTTVCFVASLSVILLIISGAPLHNKFCTWLLTVAMAIAIMFMAFAFLQSLLLMTPDLIFDNVEEMYNISFHTWIALFGFVGLVASIRFLRWLLIHLPKFKQLIINLLNYLRRRTDPANKGEHC